MFGATKARKHSQCPAGHRRWAMHLNFGGARLPPLLQVAAFAAAGLWAVAGAPAQASTLYGTSGSVGSPPVYRINQSTGVPTVLWPSVVTGFTKTASAWRSGAWWL